MLDARRREQGKTTVSTKMKRILKINCPNQLLVGSVKLKGLVHWPSLDPGMETAVTKDFTKALHRIAVWGQNTINAN